MADRIADMLNSTYVEIFCKLSGISLLVLSQVALIVLISMMA